MAPNPLKFRCDRCDQLLGVSPAKAGHRVKCPRCGTGLVVPGPAGQPTADRGTSGPLPSAPGTAQAASMGIRPEDGPHGFFDGIDLEREELQSLFTVDSDELPSTPNPDRGGRGEDEDREGFPAGFIDLAPDRGPPPDRPVSGPGTVLSFEPEPAPDGLIVRDPERSSRAAGVPGEGSGPASSTARGRPGRDVVIPRVAFVAWALFVLLSLFLAFVSGLLAGRFVWTSPS